MAYKVSYMTKRGGGMQKTFPTNIQAFDEIKRLFKRRQPAQAKKENTTIGEVYKTGKTWNWYFDTEA